MSLYTLIPDHQALLSLEPEELAGIVLQYLNSLGPQHRDQLNRYNFGLTHTVAEYPQEFHYRLNSALMEAWIWLEREGLLAPQPGEDGGWVFITRRGRQLQTVADVESYRKANLLPRQLLHPIIAQKVWASFLRGDYDAAVFQAFKEVEVAVRDAGPYPPELVGTDLMRKAFDAKAGLLRNRESPTAEREALAHLFAGAIGSYKNPHSHRRVQIDSEEAVEMIMLASHLLKIVDSRRHRNGG